MKTAYGHKRSTLICPTLLNFFATEKPWLPYLEGRRLNLGKRDVDVEELSKSPAGESVKESEFQAIAVSKWYSVCIHIGILYRISFSATYPILKESLQPLD